MEGSLSRNDTLAATCWSDDNISFAVIRGSGIRAVDKANLSEAVVAVFFSFPFFFLFFFWNKLT